jgi:hypothetical protein
LTTAFCLIAVSFTRLEGPMAAVFMIAVLALTIRMLWNLDALSLEESGPIEEQPPDGGKEKSQ